MVNYMEYIVLAIPILLGVIISKRYNIIFVFISTFTMAYFMYFLLLESGIIPLTLIESFKDNCLEIALIKMSDALVAPVYEFFGKLFGTLKMGDLWVNMMAGKKWNYFIFMFIIFLIGHVISHFFRKKRIKELKQLKKDARR